MQHADLTLAGSPLDAADIMRRAAERYREDAEQLRSTWQDKAAGKIWDDIASGLEALADRTERAWAKI